MNVNSEPIIRGLKSDIFEGKIRFIYVGFNCKRKKWGKKMSGNFAIKGGGVGCLMANAILNFHFDYLTPSLTRSTLAQTNYNCMNTDTILIATLDTDVC